DHLALFGELDHVAEQAALYRRLDWRSSASVGASARSRTASMRLSRCAAGRSAAFGLTDDPKRPATEGGAVRFQRAAGVSAERANRGVCPRSALFGEVPTGKAGRFPGGPRREPALS